MIGSRRESGPLRTTVQCDRRCCVSCSGVRHSSSMDRRKRCILQRSGHIHVESAHAGLSTEFMERDWRTAALRRDEQYRAAACGTAAVWTEESGGFCNGVDIFMLKVRMLVCQPSSCKEMGELPPCAETRCTVRQDSCKAGCDEGVERKAVRSAADWTYSW